MAIGKAGAYATVEGPKVDFGDIALNAQKIQQADLDRMKSMIPEPKKSSYEYEKVEGKTEVSNIAVYDKAMTENVNKLTERATQLNKNAEAAGGWTADGKAELNSINNQIKTYNNSTKLFTEKAKAFSEDYSKGIYSGLGEKNMDYLENLSKLKNTDIKYENGNWVARLVSTDDEGNLRKNEDGSYVYEKYNDKGVLKDSVSLDDFNTGKFYNSFIKKTDTPAVIKKIASNLDPTFQVTDNGVVKHTTTFFNDKQKEALNSYVDSYFSEVDNLADFLYQNQSGDTWKEPMTMEEYKKNGGLETAKSILKNQVESAFGFKNQRDVTLKTNKGAGGDGLSAKGIVKSIVPNTISQYVASDVGEFYNVQEAKANVSGGTVFGLKKNKKGQNVKYNLPSGSVLNGFTVGKNGSALIRVFVPTSKSSSMVKNKLADLRKQVTSGALTQSDADFELGSYTTGLDGTMQYYYAPETTINTMLPKGVDYTEVIKSIRNTRTPNIR